MDELRQKIINALLDPKAPWYGSDLVEWVGEYVERSTASSTTEVCVYWCKGCVVANCPRTKKVNISQVCEDKACQMLFTGDEPVGDIMGQINAWHSINDLCFECGLDRMQGPPDERHIDKVCRFIRALAARPEPDTQECPYCEGLRRVGVTIGNDGIPCPICARE